MRFRHVAVLLLGLTQLVHADEAARTKLRLAAEGFEKSAKAGGGDADYVKCGQAYLDIYNDDPKAPDVDEALYNAGVCFQQGSSVGVAIATFERIDARSKLRPKALGRTAKLYEMIGMLPKAADALEQYAKLYGGEKDAKDALSDATYLRRALGDDDKAIANAKFFTRNYGAKDPAAAAAATYAMTDIYSRRNASERERHLRDFLRDYGGKDRELALRANLELAESLWKRSCPVFGTDGLCMKLERPRTLPVAARPNKPTPAAKRCGPAGTPTMTIVARDAKLVDEASKLLEATEKMVGQLSSPSPAGNYYLAKAKLLLADRELEAYGAITFPTGLDFSPEPARKRTREASLQKFNDFLSSRTRSGSKAQASLTAILALKDPTTAIGAAHRLGMLSQSLANELMNAEIPRDVRTGEFAKDKVEAFCDKMMETAEPLLKQAIVSFDHCVTKASELGLRDATTRACARERAALGPTTFSLSTELLPEAPLPLPIFDEEPVRKTRKLAPPMREAVEAFWTFYGPAGIPDGKCLPLAQKFEAIAKQTDDTDAWFMAGMTYGRCQSDAGAKAGAAYGEALKLDRGHAKSISNNGYLAARYDQLGIAEVDWERAIALDPKLFGAHLGLATIKLEKYRALAPAAPRSPAAAQRAKLAQEIWEHASSAAAVGNDGSPLPYVQLGILALLDNQIPLAKYYAQRAQRIDSAPHTLVLLAAIAKGESAALPHLDAADQGTWKLDETKLARALQLIALGRYEDAGKSLAQLKPRRVRLPDHDYAVLIARGVVARGMGKLTDAEARYQEAIKIDPARVEAHFNLGVLWKDYTAARATDSTAAKAAFKKAADAFRRANTPEAKLLADDCDKAIAVLP